MPPKWRSLFEESSDEDIPHKVISRSAGSDENAAIDLASQAHGVGYEEVTDADDSPSESASADLSSGDDPRQPDWEISSLGSSNVSFDDSTHEDSPADGSNSRPRFKGSRYEYLRQTQSERDLIASLDALEADDLSIHLYNTHALKRRLRPPDDRGQNVNQWDRKDKWATAGNRNVWTPRAKWTAWPLPPERVPRPWERFSRKSKTEDHEEDLEAQDEDLDITKQPLGGREKPSRELEECLLGEILSEAREQFYASRRNTSESSIAKGPPRKKRKTTHSEAAVSTDDDVSSAELTDSPSRGLSFMADEDVARTLVQPAIRHVLAKYDTLLTALHHSRENHLAEANMDSESDAESHLQSSSERPSSSGASSSRPVSERQKRKSERLLQMNLRGLQPRDWSEVLGTAMIIGWDENVVKRASARCSDLFGESMTFRTLREEDKVQRVNPDDGPSYGGIWERLIDLKNNAPIDSQLSRDTSSIRLRCRANSGALVCPVKSCSRYKQNFRGRGELTRHMKIRHGYDESQEENANADDESSVLESDSSADEMHGGVHVDGFMKPIKWRAEWVRQRRKRTATGALAGAESEHEDKGDIEDAGEHAEKGDQDDETDDEDHEDPQEHHAESAESESEAEEADSDESDTSASDDTPVT